MHVYAFIDSRILSKLKYVDSEYHVFEKNEGRLLKKLL